MSKVDLIKTLSTANRHGSNYDSKWNYCIDRDTDKAFDIKEYHIHNKDCHILCDDFFSLNYNFLTFNCENCLICGNYIKNINPKITCNNLDHRVEMIKINCIIEINKKIRFCRRNVFNYNENIITSKIKAVCVPKYIRRLQYYYFVYCNPGLPDFVYNYIKEFFCEKGDNFW